VSFVFVFEGCFYKRKGRYGNGKWGKDIPYIHTYIHT